MFNKNKKSISLEKEYHSFLKEEKIKLTRIMCLMSSLLFLVFIAVDFWAIPSAVSEAVVIRSFVIASLLIVFILSFSKSFIKYYSYIVASIYLIATLGIDAMIYLAIPTDHAYDTYFVGLILILITLFSWSYLKLRVSLSLAVLSVALYIAIEFYHRDLIANDRYSVLITNMFFLVSAAIIGFIAQNLRDKYLRQNFLLQRSLQDAYDKKSIEARDNEYLANHDPLTDLPNRRYMTELLNASLEEASQKDKVLVIMFIDLNGFKKVNDLYGHNAGDEVLMIVAKRLELAIRKGDHLSRLGGDEYLLGLLMEKENLDEVEAMANKFISIISQSMNVEGLRVKIGASIGVAAYPIHANNIESLMSIADQRMYKAKRRKSSGDFFEDSTLNKKDESVVIFPGNAKGKNR